MQNLIFPVNQAVISAGFMNKNYRQKFGFEHYGVDMFGSSKIYAQGYGIVADVGYSSGYGNYVTILYADCRNRFGTLACLGAN